jgi:glycine cleavage system regulatory protein
MKKFIVASAVGKDRPGFVNRITHAIKELGGNIEMQRSAQMADEFALITLFSVEGGHDQVRAASARLVALAGDDLLVTARPAMADTATRPAGALPAELQASGADQPGIIETVTLLLYQHDINIESMDFDTESAPFTGEALFRMTARLAVPSDTDVEKLRQEFRNLETAFNFDILFRCPAGD